MFQRKNILEVAVAGFFTDMLQEQQLQSTDGRKHCIDNSNGCKSGYLARNVAVAEFARNVVLNLPDLGP